MKIIRFLCLLMLAGCGAQPAYAGALGNQLRAIATKVDALEAFQCPVIPPVTQPPVEQPPSSTLKPLAADPITGTFSPPGLGKSFVDPAYGLTITQASSGNERQEYSRRQMFNADNSLYLIQAVNGYWFTYSTRTFAKGKQLNFLAGDAEPLWSPTDPKKLLFTGQNGQGGTWYWLDVEANTRTTAFSLAGKAPFPSAKSFWTKAEGTTSADGRVLTLMAETYNAGGSVTFYGVLTVDTATGASLGSRAGGARPDHVSTSPSGRFAVISGDSAEVTVACPVDFKTECRKLHTKSEHSDLAFGPNREDLYVYTDYTVGQIVAKNIATGASFNITPLYPVSGAGYAAHISGQAFGMPGWVVISTYADFSNYSTKPATVLQPQYRKVFLAELKPSGRLLSVMHNRAVVREYRDEPQATISRDGQYIGVATNLGSTVSNAYIVRLPKL